MSHKFISHNLYFFSRDCRFKTYNSDLISRKLQVYISKFRFSQNCKFLTNNSDFISRNSEFIYCITILELTSHTFYSELFTIHNSDFIIAILTLSQFWVCISQLLILWTKGTVCITKCILCSRNGTFHFILLLKHKITYFIALVQWRLWSSRKHVSKTCICQSIQGNAHRYTTLSMGLF